MADIAWLTARPIAHRGLHDAAAGVIENTATAFAAAIRAGYGIETDIQVSADGEAMVHHDDVLGRLTHGSERLDRMTAAAIHEVAFKATADRILSLGDLCDLVDGRTPLLIELKSHFDGDRRLVGRAAAVLQDYRGPAALMSFDPGMIEALRHMAPGVTRGIVAERRYTHAEWQALPGATKRDMAWLTHMPRSRPQFLAYSVKDLPAAPAWIAHRIFGLPLLTWTVRSADDRARAARYADQIIFEGFRP